MTLGLKRYQESQQSHCVTFSCFHRLPLLVDSRVREEFLSSLERMRRLYSFRVYGYVLMPEHVHLLVSEPERELLATAILALKVSVALRTVRFRRDGQGTLWQKRYYDHNVRTYEKFVEKLRYIHRNPVKRGLVEKPEDWKWSSFRHYALAEVGPVEIESQWTADRRNGRTPRLMSVSES